MTANRDDRCEEYLTEPGVIYHAHDLVRCPNQAIAWYHGRHVCMDHMPPAINDAMKGTGHQCADGCDCTMARIERGDYD